MRRSVRLLAAGLLVAAACGRADVAISTKSSPPPAPPAATDGDCRLVSVAEVASAVAVSLTDTSAAGDNCSFLSPDTDALVAVTVTEGDRAELVAAIESAMAAFGADNVARANGDLDGYLISPGRGRIGALAWRDGRIVSVDVRGIDNVAGPEVLGLVALVLGRIS